MYRKQQDNTPVTMTALSKVLARAAKSEFYRSRIVSGAVTSLEQWQQMPLTTKQDLQEAYPYKMLAVPFARVASYHESSGTSGSSTASLFTSKDWDDIASRFLRSAANWSINDRIMIKTPYSMVTTAHQAHRAAQQCGAMIIPADNRTSIMPYTRVVRLLRDLAVTSTWSLPTEPILWALCAQKLGLDPETAFPALRSFLVAGEPLGTEKRARISQLWGGVKVFQDYGSTETGSLAGECDMQRLHLWNDRVFFEVISADGKLGFSGTGRLIVTPLFREAMPLIRYDMGDLVTISDEPCLCGASSPVVTVHGRSTDHGNSLISQATLDELVYGLSFSHGVHLWRAREHRRHLEIEIIAGQSNLPDTDDDEKCDIKDELAHRIFRQTGIKADVRTVNIEDFISASAFSPTKAMLKPKFLFRANETWANAFDYQ